MSFPWPKLLSMGGKCAALVELGRWAKKTLTAAETETVVEGRAPPPPGATGLSST